MSAWPEQLVLDAGPITAVELALFAAASGDHNPLHLDEGVARAAGFERPIVHGMLTMAHVSRLVTGRFGAARVRLLETRFTGVLLRGDALRIEGTLAAVDGDGCARYRLRATAKGDGHEVATGTARVTPSPAP
jgi:acyl dehydratase